jgi:hypothetical protein
LQIEESRQTQEIHGRKALAQTQRSQVEPLAGLQAQQRRTEEETIARVTVFEVAVVVAKVVVKVAGAQVVEVDAVVQGAVAGAVEQVVRVAAVVQGAVVKMVDFEAVAGAIAVAQVVRGVVVQGAVAVGFAVFRQLVKRQAQDVQGRHERTQTQRSDPLDFLHPQQRYVRFDESEKEEEEEE